MIGKDIVMRVGRPTDHLEAITKMYTEGLGFSVIGGFDNHGDFSGRMVGHHKHHFHLEFTTHAEERAGHAPSSENLLVFYLPDEHEYQETISSMHSAGFKQVKSFNPYWENNGQTFEDLDGYRVVITNAKSPF